MQKRRLPSVAGCVAASALVVSSLAGVPSAHAQASNPFERGPAPTNATVEASRGSFSITETKVSSSSVSGFGGGTIYHPTSSTETFGAVVMAPPFMVQESAIAWFGPRLASQGFVVFGINVNSTADQPASRGRQVAAAFDYLTEQSAAKAKIDPDRLGVMGHSMGGGGSLSATENNPAIKASVPLTPWHTQKNWSKVKVPTLIVAAENDTVASVGSHARPFYDSLGGEKAYLEFAGASHFAPNTPDTTMAKYTLSWLKRFVDEDTRYDQFLCGSGAGSERGIGKWEATCPFPGGGGAPSNPGGPSEPAPAPAPAPERDCAWYAWWCRI